MTGPTDARVRELLKEVRRPDAEDSPSRDLWPAVRARVVRPSPSPAAADWLLLAAIALICLLRPAALHLLLLHL
jgi:hypothetical protein